jgi:hypothetical protein
MTRYRLLFAAAGAGLAAGPRAAVFPFDEDEAARFASASWAAIVFFRYSWCAFTMRSNWKRYVGRIAARAPAIQGLHRSQVTMSSPVWSKNSHLPVRSGHAEPAILVLELEVARLDLAPVGGFEVGQEPLARAAQLGVAADLVETHQQLGIGGGRLAHGTLPKEDVRSRRT